MARGPALRGAAATRRNRSPDFPFLLPFFAPTH
jgi:hypothetical protein